MQDNRNDTDKQVSFEFVKECRRELKKNFKGIESFSYGYCCSTDYYDGKSKSQMNENDYVNAKIFKGGLNNCFHNGRFHLGDSLYYNWGLKNFKINDIIKVMQNVANKYNYIVIAPKNEKEAIIVKLKEVV